MYCKKMETKARHFILFRQHIYIPGGHSMQPSFPSEEEFVKVPTGHGSK